MLEKTAKAETARSPLLDRIEALIAADGPLTIGQYMQICLSDPRFGYYRRRDAIGAQGDFVTAPQISQVFGEMIGVWCAGAWFALGRPARLVLAEAGPGLGTLMSDLLRATRPIEGFHAALDVRLIETSPAMRSRQAALLAPWRDRIAWCEELEQLPAGPLVLIANEFLDALPFRQFVRHGAVWQERGIGIGADGRLTYVLCSAVLGDDHLPAELRQAPAGSIFELSPAREAFVAATAERHGRDGGFALFIDYGHAKPGLGDTFQAVRDHKFADPLAAPGLADLTSHVDFAALATAAAEQGAIVSPIVTQRQLLLDLGLAARADALRRRASAEQAKAIDSALERLIAPSHMGDLFKALAIARGAPTAFPPFTAAEGV